MIIGNTKQSMQPSAAITAERQRITAMQRSAAAEDGRRGASPGRGGAEGGGVRATATPTDAASAQGTPSTNSAQAMTGPDSAVVNALLFALIAQRMNTRLAAQTALA
ncbi:hypothetical protein [Pandoraea apista]|mgnify:CR=1 FL=1|uniref:Uncharacterized protein n=1 Tax=Pandoraea apista TaxID=93218 RepID=A0A5E5P4K2_9BURK|nr:hypothetical protein [Pandoraea apista]AJF00241.1 hypothetical protein SG18_22425 [Pandoraea apista]AKH74406.1 hypothetical protein XM39_22605 [Pandoraea apista]AKI62956.1 hypothetical protein AA956_15930 [Pandoraea apista]AVF41201.1 hypothetical protein AL486_16970 [Pandoraea apista]OXS88815.1 hypothetical protein B7H01_24280 [Pandoraea apista]